MRGITFSVTVSITATRNFKSSSSSSFADCLLVAAVSPACVVVAVVDGCCGGNIWEKGEDSCPTEAVVEGALLVEGLLVVDVVEVAVAELDWGNR